MALGNLAIYAFGVPWLMGFAHLSLGKALALGVVPFLAVTPSRSPSPRACSRQAGSSCGASSPADADPVPRPPRHPQLRTRHI